MIPLLRAIPPVVEDRETACEVLALDSKNFLVCCFGILGPLKLNHVILDAWLALPEVPERKARLVFVGTSHDPVYEAELKAILDSHINGHTVSITGYVNQATYRRYLAAADLGIQLRSSSRGETSAAVLDCMASAIPTIVNAHGSMAELPEDVVLKLPDQVTAEAVGEALLSLLGDANWRKDIGQRALVYCQRSTRSEPNRCALS